MAQKEALVRELLAHEGSLGDSFYGRIVLRNCNIAHYKRRQAAWQSRQWAEERKRELFQDIIADSVTSGDVLSGDVVSDDIISKDRTLNPCDTVVASARDGGGTAEKRCHKRLKKRKQSGSAGTESGRDGETAGVECVPSVKAKKHKLQLFEANAPIKHFVSSNSTSLHA